MGGYRRPRPDASWRGWGQSRGHGIRVQPAAEPADRHNDNNPLARNSRPCCDSRSRAWQESRASNRNNAVARPGIATAILGLWKGCTPPPRQRTRRALRIEPGGSSYGVTYRLPVSIHFNSHFRDPTQKFEPGFPPPFNTGPENRVTVPTPSSEKPMTRSSGANSFPNPVSNATIWSSAIYNLSPGMSW